MHSDHGVSRARLPSAALPDPSRRRLLRLLPIVALAASSPWKAHCAVVPPPSGRVRSNPPTRPRYGFFSQDDATFVDAAVDRLIPADQHGPGARQTGATVFIDRCLQGAWRANERLYRNQFWHAGLDIDGFLLPESPGSLFRSALRGIEADLAPRLAGWPSVMRRRGSARHRFRYLPPTAQDTYLRGLLNTPRSLDGVPSPIFLHLLFALTVEAFFADPVFSGNEDTFA